MQQFFGLPNDGIHHRFGAMSRVQHADSAGEVDIGFSVHILDGGAVAGLNGQRGKHTHAFGDNRVAPGNELL